MSKLPDKEWFEIAWWPERSAEGGHLVPGYDGMSPVFRRVHRSELPMYVGNRELDLVESFEPEFWVDHGKYRGQAALFDPDTGAFIDLSN